MALRIIFVFVFGQISEPKYYLYSAILLNLNSICILIWPYFWTRIVFIFVFGQIYETEWYSYSVLKPLFAQLCIIAISSLKPQT